MECLLCVIQDCATLQDFAWTNFLRISQVKSTQLLSQTLILFQTKFYFQTLQLIVI